ncbi:hypothetical protein AB3X52_18845 [Nocardioides sp. DS6]|uniref:Aminoglycoside phosphotransferase family protein n=1 Tax=Nocardioides eburneus TaxID=3231482 RepID=A0ABV3T3A1_9ACTN
MTTPNPTLALPTIPHGRTARRLEWVHLPPLVRREVERRLGAKVVAAQSQDAGFTPGMAAVLTCADGSRHFVKAASAKAQRMFAEAYREEARKLKTLAGWIPAPRLRWSHEAYDWVLLCFEYVEGRAPQRPWTSSELAAVSDLLVETAGALTPPPGSGWRTFAEEHAAFPDLWDRLGHLPHAAEAAELAAGFADHTAGETLVHLDVRDDNVLIRPDGSVLLCDWNWPVLGAAWLDSLILLIGPRGDGVDVERHVAGHPLLGAVEPVAVDSVLALLAGYFLACAADPVPSFSPYVRAVQQWQGDVCLDWLAERRGW